MTTASASACRPHREASMLSVQAFRAGWTLSAHQLADHELWRPSASSAIRASMAVRRNSFERADRGRPRAPQRRQDMSAPPRAASVAGARSCAPFLTHATPGDRSRTRASTAAFACQA